MVILGVVLAGLGGKTSEPERRRDRPSPILGVALLRNVWHGPHDRQVLGGDLAFPGTTSPLNNSRQQLCPPCASFVLKAGKRTNSLVFTQFYTLCCHQEASTAVCGASSTLPHISETTRFPPFSEIIPQLQRTYVGRAAKGMYCRTACAERERVGFIFAVDCARKETKKVPCID